jgi:hypothetical protein
LKTKKIAVALLVTLLVSLLLASPVLAATKVSGVRVKALSSSKIYVSWNPVRGENYQVSIQSGKGTISYYKTSSNAITITGLKAGTKYNVSVRTYTSTKKGTVKGSWSSTATVTTAKGNGYGYGNNYKTYHVSWNWNNAPKGYQGAEVYWVDARGVYHKIGSYGPGHNSINYTPASNDVKFYYRYYWVENGHTHHGNFYKANF